MKLPLTWHQHLADLVAFLAVLATVLIMILAGHATAALLAAASTGAGGLYAVWKRRA